MAGSCPIMRDRSAFSNSSTRGVFALVSSNVLSPSFAEFISSPLLSICFPALHGLGNQVLQQTINTHSHRHTALRREIFLLSSPSAPALCVFGIVCSGIKGTWFRSLGIAKPETTWTDLLAPCQRVPLHLDVAHNAQDAEDKVKGSLLASVQVSRGIQSRGRDLN